MLAHRSPWHRRLWNIGTCLSLREVVEYADTCIQGATTSSAGLHYVIETTRRETQRDPGVAHLSTQIDATFDRLKVKTKDVPRNACDELRHLAQRAEHEYLTQWMKSELHQEVEFTARAITSHLFDLGYSPDHLYRWHRAKSPQALSGLLEEASTMTTEMPQRDFEVFVPCSAPYEKPTGTNKVLRWLNGPEASTWIQRNTNAEKPRRYTGGILFTVDAKDPWAAIDQARSIATRADARIRVAQPTSQRLKLEETAYIAGLDNTYELKPTPLRIEIGSLYRQNAVYNFDNGLPTKTDDALLLASHMESANPGAAITSGWAAIEALLIRPDEDKHYQAADRLAALITCSLPRAELTHLAYQHKPDHPDTLSEQLETANNNYQKIQLVEEHLKTGATLALTKPSDLAAQNRVQEMINTPGETLKRVNRYITESLRRLYTQRNTISHAGSLQSITLNATTRTTFSLVGAGLDRIVHAQLNDAELEPLALVARAETELELLGTPGQRPLHQLLQ